MLSERRRGICVAFLVVLVVAVSSCERPLQRGEVDSSTEIDSIEISAADDPSDSVQDPSESAIVSSLATGTARLVEEPPPSEADPGAVSGADPVPPSTTEDASAQEPGDAGTAGATAPEETTPDANEDGTALQANAGEGEATQESQSGQGQSTAADEVGAEPSSADDAPQQVSHTVAQGETLYRIGLLYGQTWQAIAQANGVFSPDYITAGQVLLIPFDKTQTDDPQIDESQIDESQTVQLETVGDGAADPVGIASHTVRLGDTLQSIATAYNISWIEIAEANGIATPNQIYPGQVLKIPTHIPGLSPEFSHEIAFGQTLYIISLIYGVPISSIAEANGLVPPYIIYAGQSLIIPRE